MLNIFSLKKWVILKIVYGCNHKCSFCHERDNIFSFNFKNILLTDLDQIYKWILENHFDYVIISGWEPSLHPSFSKIIEFFQIHNIYVVVVSNWTHILKHDYKNIDKNKITFYISYHWLEEDYNEVTQSSDFKKVTENIQNLEKIFPEIILRYVVNNKNIRNFTEFNKFVFTEFENVFLEYVLLEDLKYSHVEDTIVTIQDYHKLMSKFILQKNILIDWWIACANTYLFSNAQHKFDPLVNTMIWLVKKTKEWELIYNIKETISSRNIKSHWSKCKKCIQFDYCHGFDINYLSHK